MILFGNCTVQLLMVFYLELVKCSDKKETEQTIHVWLHGYVRGSAKVLWDHTTPIFALHVPTPAKANLQIDSGKIEKHYGSLD